MNDPREDVAAVLHAAYARQEGRYARALLAAQETAACGRGPAFDERLRQMLALLDDAVAGDAFLGETKRRWEEQGRPTGDALSGATSRIAELIRRLATELQGLESAVRARRDELAAELDVCNRRRQMHRAYLGKS